MGTDRIIIDKRIMGGKLVIRGTRIPVYLILELLASSLTVDEVLREYPELTKEDIQAALRYASDMIRHETVISIEA